MELLLQDLIEIIHVKCRTFIIDSVSKIMIEASVTCTVVIVYNP